MRMYLFYKILVYQVLSCNSNFVCVCVCPRGVVRVAWPLGFVPRGHGFEAFPWRVKALRHCVCSLVTGTSNTPRGYLGLVWIIHILDPAIWLWPKHLKTPTKPIFVMFQMFYTVKLTNSLFRSSFFLLLDAWAKSIQNTWFLIYRYLK